MLTTIDVCSSNSRLDCALKLPRRTPTQNSFLFFTEQVWKFPSNNLHPKRMIPDRFRLTKTIEQAFILSRCPHTCPNSWVCVVRPLTIFLCSLGASVPVQVEFEGFVRWLKIIFLCAFKMNGGTFGLISSVDGVIFLVISKRCFVNHGYISCLFYRATQIC